MQLNHLNLCVDDLDGAQDLFRRFFGLRVVDRKGNAVAVMDDGEGFTLVLSNPGAFGSREAVRYPEGFHVGFVLDDRTQVDDVHGRLVEAGLAGDSEPGTMRDSYGFYFTVLGGIMFEVSCVVTPRGPRHPVA